ncbi:MAG: CapA family protein, partial [Anaerolineales bacterium]|nr:CapA family protein [Anaerolineales bacterium]
PTPAPTATLTAVPPTDTPQPTTAPTATATPLPTPKTAVSLSVPAQWLERVSQALGQSEAAWEWQIVPEDTPNAAIALVNNADGVLVAQEPLVLAVPFNHSWNYANLAEAQAIVANGHPLAQAMPWSAMLPTQRPLLIDGYQPDDPEYPLWDQWSLVGQPGYETAVADLTAILQRALAPQPVIKLAAVGDVNLDRSLGNAINEGHIDYPFLNFAPYLQAADLAVGNLETSLGDVGEPQPKNYTFQSPPAAAQTLGRAGFDVVSMANNHAMDYGPESLLQGIGLLNEQGVAVIGAGASDAAARAPFITEAGGLKVAFLGYVQVPVEVTSHFDTASWTATADAPGLAWAVPAQITEDVTAVRPQVDLVVVILHSGYEYVIPPSQEQLDAAHAAIDAGADIVIGHHAHILQGVEFYKDGVIVYGLGNFAFNIDGEPNTVLLNIWLDTDGVRQLEFIPAIIQFGGQPRLATPDEGAVILQQIYDRSRAFPMP